MLPLLLNKIIQTDKLLFLHLVTQKNRIYTFLNPVSYLIALENKSLFVTIRWYFCRWLFTGFCHKISIRKASDQT